MILYTEFSDNLTAALSVMDSGRKPCPSQNPRNSTCCLFLCMGIVLFACGLPFPGRILFPGITHKIHKIHGISPAACFSVWILCPPPPAGDTGSCCSSVVTRSRDFILRNRSQNSQNTRNSSCCLILPFICALPLPGFYFPESLTKFTKYTKFLLLPVSLCGYYVPRLRRGTQQAIDCGKPGSAGAGKKQPDGNPSGCCVENF